MIEVNNLNKKFCDDLRRSLLYGVKDIGREIVGAGRKSDRLRKSEFWALHDISFSISQGQSVGLIGSNGAGKSTLLRIISGLIKPDAGTVKVKGRVAPLIALGAGFNPILTGRENVFVNMAILGLKKEEIKKKFDEVIDFSELEHALDMPVQTYSSGMAARLGFSCAIFTHPEILLIDEVLAVGDLRFRAKCYRKLAELKKLNTTFIMVSHSPQSILSICDVGMYLKKGQLMGFGATTDIMNQYEADLSKLDLRLVNSADGKPKEKYSNFKIEKIFFEDAEHAEVVYPSTGRPGNLTVSVESDKEYDNLNIQIAISDASLYGERTLFFNNAIDDFTISVKKGFNRISLRFPYLGLNPGLYTLKVSIYQDELHLLDTIEAFNFVVKSDFPARQSLFFQSREWLVSQK